MRPLKEDVIPELSAINVNLFKIFIATKRIVAIRYLTHVVNPANVDHIKQ